VPELLIFTVTQVAFSSPESKQPILPLKGFGLVEGLLILLVELPGKSITAP
jgi:hypothetical protein